MSTGDEREFGHLVVERSGGIGGFRLVWDLDIDRSSRREEIGARVAELPWQEDTGAGGPDVASGASAEAPGTRTPGSGSPGVPGGADRFVYAIESRFGQVRFGEGELSGEWKRIVDEVREITEPERRRPQ
ncbi:hypothetical protein DFO66_104126 [Brevibacterium sanguinis]|uniref:Uncharacterized protein n=2 Tax=Brevibacterium TaxID=1696 RepID=A0A366IMB1_9MICO|nr:MULTISPECIES: hypothetical protein [Brevibacterium]RBP65542.1 hypothetical protein DFO66_104126 [Brevibacterium sanguinis]RBP72176.1 hypothetical protein DFO65_104132 [Brevibacterium celere]